MQIAVSHVPINLIRWHSHPTVPVFGVVDSVAVIAPPNKRLAVGIVHVASAIVNVVAVPALPSVGGALTCHQKCTFVEC